MGCGKTAVAFLAIMAAAGSGYQAAMMLPTEILAAQTQAKLQALIQRMPEDMQPRAAILTGSTRARERREVCVDVRLDHALSLASTPLLHRLHPMALPMEALTPHSARRPCGQSCIWLCTHCAHQIMLSLCGIAGRAESARWARYLIGSGTHSSVGQNVAIQMKQV